MYTRSPAETDVVSARRLLGLDAAAGPAEIETAVRAARAAIRVPEDAHDLAPTAAHLNSRLDHARAVLLATTRPEPEPVAVAVPPPPTPPTPPLAPRTAETYAGAAPTPADVVQPHSDATTRADKARQKRSEHTRAGVHSLVLVVLLLVLGGGAFAITRALSRSGPTAHGTSSTTTAYTTYTTPSTTLVRSFADRLVEGELGRAPEGIQAPSARTALQVWLAGFQSQDADLVSRGMDDQSRLKDLAEIGSRSSPADLDAIGCNSFGSGMWRCHAGAVTSPEERIEVTKVADGWRIRGWAA